MQQVQFLNVKAFKRLLQSKIDSGKKKVDVDIEDEQIQFKHMTFKMTFYG